MLDVWLNDDTNAWDLFSDGRYVLRSAVNPDELKTSQEIFTNEARFKAMQLSEDKTALTRGDSGVSPLRRMLNFILPKTKR